MEKTDRRQIVQGGPENVSQHVEWVAGRVQVLLSHYFQPDSPSEILDAAIDDWVDMISQFSEADINRACSTYLRDQPRRRPTPGDIRARCMTYREEAMRKYRRSLPPPPEEPTKPRVTKEEADRITSELGFTPDLGNILKRFPLARSVEEVKALDARRDMTCETNLERLKRARAAAGLPGERTL